MKQFEEALRCLDLAINLHSTSYKVCVRCVAGGSSAQHGTWESWLQGFCQLKSL